MIIFKKWLKFLNAALLNAFTNVCQSKTISNDKRCNVWSNYNEIENQIIDLITGKNITYKKVMLCNLTGND